MQLTEKQTADYERLRSYYPYRLFFLAKTKENPEGVVWALRDRRAVNQALKEGAEIFEIKAE